MNDYSQTVLHFPTMSTITDEVKYMILGVMNMTEQVAIEPQTTVLFMLLVISIGFTLPGLPELIKSSTWKILLSKVKTFFKSPVGKIKKHSFR